MICCIIGCIVWCCGIVCLWYDVGVCCCGDVLCGMVFHSGVWYCAIW